MCRHIHDILGYALTGNSEGVFSTRELRMLIVEDEFLSRKLLLTQVSPLGSCDLADDGRKAVSAVAEAMEAGRPYDLIFMDLRMPEMDGLEAIRAIRALEAAEGNGATKASKILVTSALNDPHFVIEAFKKECDGYLTKPFVRHRLEKEIAKRGLA